MKKAILSIAIASAALTACTTEQVGQFARAMQTNAPATPQVTPKPSVPAAPPVSLASAGTLNQCRTELSPSRDALLVTAGHNNSNQYYTCAVGSPMTLRRASPSFNAHLIALVCDLSKPVVNTPVDDGDNTIVNCTYPGPGRLPSVVDGVPVKAI
ncbi:hypothetical protein GTP23_13135 [Pseudoduganella sp. FT93W]|uniref:Lipoprotein n=1 Tax=Duganella fentianensis TaxID=2692177 RepID=A0A845HY97_9BURK|nr:hypothetical protein [Duganella fentianensis]MYN45993.1 hypothetical protein [Duganella fentianensis]